MQRDKTIFNNFLIYAIFLGKKYSFSNHYVYASHVHVA